MKLSLILAVSTALILSACATSDGACEDVTLASEQIQQCQALQRQIVAAKNKPLIRTELERRYQADCIDIRYYRDDHQAAVCGNKDKMDEYRKSVIEEQKQ